PLAVLVPALQHIIEQQLADILAGQVLDVESLERRLAGRHRADFDRKTLGDNALIVEHDDVELQRLEVGIGEILGHQISAAGSISLLEFVELNRDFADLGQADSGKQTQQQRNG